MDARVGDLLQAGFPPASFDAIMMENVIEHLPNPDRVFAECRRILKRGGRLVMITSNFDSEGRKRFGPDWRGLEVPWHLFLYTPPALRRLAKQAGFARAEVFSPAISGKSTAFMLEKSGAIAEASGRRRIVANARTMAWRAFGAMLLGRDTGEWIVLVARP